MWQDSVVGANDCAADAMRQHAFWVCMGQGVSSGASRSSKVPNMTPHRAQRRAWKHPRPCQPGRQARPRKRCQAGQEQRRAAGTRAASAAAAPAPSRPPPRALAAQRLRHARAHCAVPAASGGLSRMGCTSLMRCLRDQLQVKARNEHPLSCVPPHPTCSSRHWHGRDAAHGNKQAFRDMQSDMCHMRQTLRMRLRSR